jgi:hypothetical protein
MISPDQVDRLQDQLDRFTGILIVGCLIFFVGGTMGIFASQEFSDGTNFMMRLAGGEQALGLLLILIGWIKVHSIKVELERHAPAHGETRTSAAASGHD